MRPLRLALVVSVLTLLSIGLVMLYSHSMWTGESFFWKQVMWLLPASAAAVFAYLAGPRFLTRYYIPWIVYAVALALLLAVLVPGVGTKVNGARRWLFGLQPSELAKLALVLVLAHYASARQGRMEDRETGFTFPVLMAGVLCLLVFLEPDWGTAIIMAIVSAGLLLVAGTRYSYLVVTTVIAGEFLFSILCNNLVRLHRFFAFLDPQRYADSYAWQPWHVMLALGRGFVTGTGVGDGSFKMGFISEQHTDFILSLVGEEFGFVGTSLVLLAFITLVICGMNIAWRAPDPFSQLLAVGLTMLLGVQAFVNIGVATSSLPNKGTTLPFISYGGSSLVCCFACIGLLLGIEARSGRANSKE